MLIGCGKQPYNHANDYTKWRNILLKLGEALQKKPVAFVPRVSNVCHSVAERDFEPGKKILAQNK